ncbi:MAG TPA: DUF4124 domain-containing protein [Casimicrobiaceae bacterium]|nr:DUF4124 domain-containing protein [Casimicrobiaceae bacterium]
MSDRRYPFQRGPRAIRVDARRIAALLLCALVATAAGRAHAALYKWIDEHGIVHYSDKLPIEAVNRANSELSRQAITLHKTEQARPAVQRVAKSGDNDEQKLREAERERLLAMRRDRALLESYANEAEIDLAKSRAMATIDGQLQSAHAFVAQMSKRRRELDDKKPTFAPRPVPGAIVREIETIDAEVARQNELIAAKQKESAAVAARYDADKQRFRELRAGPGGGVVTSSDGRLAENLELTSAR